jgi:hypothetical protein
LGATPQAAAGASGGAFFGVGSAPASRQSIFSPAARAPAPAAPVPRVSALSALGAIGGGGDGGSWTMPAAAVFAPAPSPATAAAAATAAVVAAAAAAIPLTAAQRESFLAARFERGSVPEVPPPDELCK